MAEIKPMTEDEIDQITEGAGHYAPSVSGKLWRVKMEIRRLKVEEAGRAVVEAELRNSIEGLEADVEQLQKELKEARRDRSIAQREVVQLRKEVRG